MLQKCTVRYLQGSPLAGIVRFTRAVDRLENNLPLVLLQRTCCLGWQLHFRREMTECVQNETGNGG